MEGGDRGSRQDRSQPVATQNGLEWLGLGAELGFGWARLRVGIGVKSSGQHPLGYHNQSPILTLSLFLFPSLTLTLFG